MCFTDPFKFATEKAKLSWREHIVKTRENDFAHYTYTRYSSEAIEDISIIVYSSGEFVGEENETSKFSFQKLTKIPLHLDQDQMNLTWTQVNSY